MREVYGEWNPVVKALCDVTPEIRFYPNFSCETGLESWILGEGRVVLIGDAAHAHGGAYATGGSLAIEDAYTLSLALFSVFPVGETRKPRTGELKRALRLYEDVRKPHAEKLLEKVHKASEAKLGRLREGLVETDGELRERARKGTDTAWLHEYHVVKAFESVAKRTGGDAKL